MAMLSSEKPNRLASILPRTSGTRAATVQCPGRELILMSRPVRFLLAFSMPSVSTQIKKAWSPYFSGVMARSSIDSRVASTRAVIPLGS
jgi:hypothetical protein